MFFALLAALAIATAAPAPAPKPIAQGSWITSEDYPDPALRAAQEGRVAYRLDVDATGAVTGCTILTSSGSPVLDVHTCDLLRLRARFEPAHDQMNHAISSQYSSGTTWAIPDGRPWDVSGIEPVQGQTLDLVVGSDGRIKRCTLVAFVGPRRDLLLSAHARNIPAARAIPILRFAMAGRSRGESA